MKSTLAGAIRLAVAAGAREVLVPAGPAPRNISSEVDALSAFDEEGLEKKYVRRVDTNSRIEREVVDFLQPLMESVHEDSREAILVRCAATPLYRLLVAAQYNASVWDANIHRILHDFQGVRASRFPKDLRIRLSPIADVVTSYLPATFPGVMARGSLGPAAAVERLREAIDSETYKGLSDEYGRLGFAKNPRLAARLLMVKAKRIVATPQFRGGLVVGSLASQLAAGPAGAAVIGTFQAALQFRPSSTDYSPPLIETDADLNESLWRGAFAHRSGPVKPDEPRATATFVEHTLLQCGHSMVGSRRRPSLRALRKLPTYDQEWPGLIRGVRAALVA